MNAFYDIDIHEQQAVIERQKARVYCARGELAVEEAELEIEKVRLSRLIEQKEVAKQDP